MIQRSISGITMTYWVVLLFSVIVCNAEFIDIPTGSWPLGLEPDILLPNDNPLSDTVVLLGKRLFFDVRLSKDISVSCATCHKPEFGFSNTTPVAEGIFKQKGKRKVPSLVNRIFGQSQFWDGRAASLEDQIVAPLFNPIEMGIDEKTLIERLQKDSVYPHLFREAFGSEISLDGVVKAIASFERTLVSGGSPFDRYEWNGEENALSDSSKRGLELFRGKARCSLCHTGVNFTDERFHNIGVCNGEGQEDPGRMAITNDPMDFGKFRTPSLRNVDLRAPYMHNGSISNLEEVIEFYNNGGRQNPNLDKELKPLNLSAQEKVDLVEFLKSLTGPIISVKVEELRRIAE
jgi:cytochrome c peroxidase